MQRFLKFATSPNANRRPDHPEDRDSSPSRDAGEKLKYLSLSPPLQAKQRQELELGGGGHISSEPSSPRPSTSPPSSTSPPIMSNNHITPARYRRMAFFNSNRYSLDEFSQNHKGGLRSVPSADCPSPPTTVSPPTHHRRAAVHLASSPIRLLNPKSGGLSGLSTGTGSAAQMTNFGDLEYMNTSNEGYRLTAQQKELVRQAWRSGNERGGSAAGVWIFKRIFTHNPHLKRVFNLHEVEDERDLDGNPQFKKHAQVFTDVLEMIVECIDALDDSLGPLLLSYGSKHVKFESGHGFSPEYWDAFAVAMTEYATNNWKFMKNSSRRAEALRAWRILVFFCVSKVKQGFVLEKKAREAAGIDQYNDE